MKLGHVALVAFAVLVMVAVGSLLWTMRAPARHNSHQLNIQISAPEASAPVTPDAPKLVEEKKSATIEPAPPPVVEVPVKPAEPPAAPQISPVTRLFAGERWTKAIDLTKSLDRGENGIERNGASRLNVPCPAGVLDNEYDLRVVFTRTSGKGGLAQSLTLGRKHFQWIIGGPDNTSTGFERVDGKMLEKNATLMKQPVWLELGQRHESIVQVRRRGVKAFLDGKFVADWTDLTRLSGPEENLTLTTYDGATIFHKIELLPSGSGDTYSDAGFKYSRDD